MKRSGRRRLVDTHEAAIATALDGLVVGRRAAVSRAMAAADGADDPVAAATAALDGVEFRRGPLVEALTVARAKGARLGATFAATVLGVDSPTGSDRLDRLRVGDSFALDEVDVEALALLGLLDSVDDAVDLLEESTVGIIAGVSARGVVAGMTAAAVGASVAERVAGGYRARVVADYEVGSAVEAASVEVFAANGVLGWEWACAGDCCPLCAGTEGEYVYGDPTPPLHPNCMCVAVPLL